MWREIRNLTTECAEVDLVWSDFRSSSMLAEDSCGDNRAAREREEDVDFLVEVDIALKYLSYA